MKNLKFIISFILLLSIVNVSRSIGISNRETSTRQLTSLVNSPLRVTTPPLIEGYLYKDVSNGKIYWYVGEKLYHIQDYGTYTHLFANPLNYQYDVSDFQGFLNSRGAPYGPVPVGTIPPGTALVNASGTVYLRFPIGSQYAHYTISSPSTMNTYHMRWDTMFNVAYTPNTNVFPFPLSSAYSPFPY